MCSLPGYPVVFSKPVDTYRYVLWRVWDITKKYLCIIGLNPSTATDKIDDNTIRKCIKFAKRYGYGGLCMINLHAFRATQPEDCFAAPDPIGPDNDSWILACVQHEQCGAAVAAWGNDGNRLGQSDRIRRMLLGYPCKNRRGRLLAFAINKTGQPAHPLYLPDTTDLIDYPDPPLEINLDD